jgi:hypothetical protein
VIRRLIRRSWRGTAPGSCAALGVTRRASAGRVPPELVISTGRSRRTASGPLCGAGRPFRAVAPRLATLLPGRPRSRGRAIVAALRSLTSTREPYALVPYRSPGLPVRRRRPILTAVETAGRRPTLTTLSPAIWRRPVPVAGPERTPTGIARRPAPTRAGPVRPRRPTGTRPGAIRSRRPASAGAGLIRPNRARPPNRTSAAGRIVIGATRGAARTRGTPGPVGTSCTRRGSCPRRAAIPVRPCRSTARRAT